VVQLLQIHNLHKTFHKGTVNENTVFDGLSLKIEDGDYITVIGSNGAGKSTLLNIISGSIEADEGSIILEGRDISRLPEYKRTKLIGRVFQDPTTGTSPSMTILENMSMALNKGKSFGLTPGVNRANISHLKKILSELSLGLEDRLNTKVALLSGGQRQALSLLMATISNPRLLLLDEHTAALDPKTSERIIELTNKIISRRNMTTLMVTHNLNHAITMGNRLVMMHRGNVVLDIKGEEKTNLTIEKLLECFEKVNSKESLSDRQLFSFA
jgi:ABC-type uncharacterized transport system, ATPase component